MMLLVFAILLLLYAFLIFYYYRGWNQLKDFKPGNTAQKNFISVIIPVRNEAKYILTLIDSLRKQTYPREYYEVIFIDDFSSDKTPHLLELNCSGNIRWITPQGQPDRSSKKNAIHSGIINAKGNLIVTTDADCTHSPNWLSIINDFYTATGSCFIAAPVKFHHGKGLLSVFQSLDFITLQGITGAGIARNFHFMCNGANLAYKKNVFFEVKGFQGIDHIASGDDMLLMYKIWKQHPRQVHFLKNYESMVVTDPPGTWKEFFRQRKRWAGKSLVYDDYRMILVLLFVYLLNLSFVVLIVASFFQIIFLLYALIFWVLKTLIEWPFVYQVSRFYKEEKLMKYFFGLQPLHIFYTVFIGLMSQAGRYEWKGRRTK
jgi:cellulose synthase/poly-beta-1,6-N-acetylglucosamine synthase-like glycosyltransferase